jgi:PTS system nitrogen regulatory IIA component
VASKFNFGSEVVSELFLDREKLMPTSLNNGIAVPHSRTFVLKGHASDIVVIVFPKQAINYGAFRWKACSHDVFFVFLGR